MANAEILRIVEVGAEPANTVEPRAPMEVATPTYEPPNKRNIRATARLALWPSPAEVELVNDAIVTRGEPVPLIRVEQVPHPARLDPRLMLLADGASAAARSYRLLRHRLFGLGDPRAITVTSAHAGEGKTACAVNLALALSEDTTAQVLLLEANVVRPVVARLFGFEPLESLLGSIVQNGRPSPPYPIAAIAGTRLHVAALPAEPEAGVRLDRSLFAATLADLRDVYDYVVVDAGAVLDGGDADVAGACADGVVLTARAGKSRRRDFRRVLDQLRPAPIFGTVLYDS